MTNDEKIEQLDLRIGCLIDDISTQVRMLNRNYGQNIDFVYNGRLHTVEVEIYDKDNKWETVAETVIDIPVRNPIKDLTLTNLGICERELLELYNTFNSIMMKLKKEKGEI